MSHSKYRSRAWFVGGLLCGLPVCLLLLRAAGWSVVATDELSLQQAQLEAVERENRELTEDLLRFRPEAYERAVIELPYDAQADARSIVTAARQDARASGKFLMITFGANWCADCRSLYRSLRSDEVAAYTADLFRFAQVDVGKFNRNLDLARELGVDLSGGIPVAIFFDPTGSVIGTTNEGQLEPARYYSSRQILRFVRNIVERSRITAPDSIEG